MIKIKEDLLNEMKRLGACAGATEYVASSKAKTAATIWKKCDQVGWLCWFAFRIRPDLAPAFAFRQADIAVRVHAVAALRAAGLTVEADKLATLPVIDSKQTADSAAYSAGLAASSARSAASSAADSAAYSAASSAAYSADSAAYSARLAASSADSAGLAASSAAYSARLAASSAQQRDLHALWPQIAGRSK